MPRPVNPESHRARRLQIIDGALSALARHGYAGATTAVICRSAGVGSGTFFHYFPTKDAVVVAILEEGTAETRDFFKAQEGRRDPRRVILDYVDRVVADLRDPRAGGFVRAVGGLTGKPDISAALQADEKVVLAGLMAWIGAGQRLGQVREDLSDGRLADWTLLLLDGFTMRVSVNAEFDVMAEAAVLKEQVELLLSGPVAE